LKHSRTDADRLQAHPNSPLEKRLLGKRKDAVLKSYGARTSVDVIIPTFNEEENIAKVILDLKQLGFRKILVIDANSRDKTADIAKKLGAHVVNQKGRGKGSALRQAFLHEWIDSDIVVMMDADGSMSATEIPRFIKALQSGADVVKGSRFLPCGGSDDLSMIRKIGNKMLLLVVNILYGTSYTDLCYGFGAFKRNALMKLTPHLSAANFEIETEICIKANRLKLKVVEVPSFELRRNGGKSNLSTFGDGFRILNAILGELLKIPERDT
jgi:glycosyltransferase involved in cell wall biosynthesis